MFGFSLQKLIVLVGIIAAVWYGFKLISRLDAARKAEAEVADKRKPGRGRFRWRRGAAPARKEAEDMVQCPGCGTYVVARSGSASGRADCPNCGPG